MKLVTYTHQGIARLGIVQDKRVLDLAHVWAAYDERGCDSHLSRVALPADMLSLLQGGQTTRQVISEMVDWAHSSGETLGKPLSDVRLAAPVVNPSKIICVGLNYHDHCSEQNRDVPERPILFSKFPSSIIGPEDEIRWPSDATQQVDYEVELAVIVGREARRILAEEANDYVAGYTIVNDVTARDAQVADRQWIRGKSFDTFCPMGPYLVTSDEVPDPHDLRIRCWVNGELRQESNTRELIFKVPELLAYLSKTSTLMPGDILSTGTPGGVGVHRDPQLFLKAGDLVEMEIEKLGRLRNRVA